MAQDVHPEFRSEDGDLEAAGPDGLGALMAWLTSDPDLAELVGGYPLLDGIDPYGLTMFNERQLPVLVAELEALAPLLSAAAVTAPGDRGRFTVAGIDQQPGEALTVLLDFLRPRLNTRSYLWFIGD